jgi:hypothetical protein
MNEEILIPLAFFAFLTAIIVIPAQLKSKERERMHETIRIAYEKGQPVPPELIDLLQRGGTGPDLRTSPDRDLRRAVVLIGVALGLVAMSFAIGAMHGEEAHYGVLAGAAIPGFIGLGFLVLWFFSRNRPGS